MVNLQMLKEEKKMLYVTSVLSNKCPRCRNGNLFITNNAYDLKNNLTMHNSCPTCGQPTEIEVGFYYGTGYVSYALSIAFLVATFVAWKVLIGLSFSDNTVFWWLGTACTLLVLIQPLMMRLSRSLWLSMFVKYDANWRKNSVEKSERMVQ
jgi:uncharacterized protein (DUF983 family)